MALDKGETALAEVARRKADQIDSESLGNIIVSSFNYRYNAGRGHEIRNR